MDARVDGGGVLGPPAELTTAIAGGSSDPAIAAASTSLRPLLDVLPASLRGGLAAATVFRTADVARDAVRMRDTVGAATPTLRSIDAVYGPAEAGERGLAALLGTQADDAVPGQINSAPRPQPHSHVALVVQATLDVPSFVSATPGVDGFPQPGPDGAPQILGRHPLRVTLSLPRTPSWTDVPVVIYAHGIGRTRQDMLTQADTAARHGLAMLAVDFAYHGSRLAEDARNDLIGTSVPDGFGDYTPVTPIIYFFHQAESGGIPAGHPRALGENMRQAAVDVVSLVEWIADGDLALLEAALPDGVPGSLSFRDDVGLLSESLGGLLAGVSLALEPRIGVAYLAAPASGFRRRR
jgi:hypothetical protein